jgi:hypothetical protein
MQRAVERTGQLDRSLHVALALACYRAEHDGYPENLGTLAPTYLQDVPGDVYTGQDLRYRRVKEGYWLYSVGANGIDEGGRGPEDVPPGDDLCVRVPMPQLKQE